MDWSYFNKFGDVDRAYLPVSGEGETMATQINTAVSKLVYKAFNDGDVFDNTNLSGWCNDLSSYANWLYAYVPQCRAILEKVWDVETFDEYTDMLAELADMLCDMEFLDKMNAYEKVGSVYDCGGPFKFIENWGDGYEEKDGWWLSDDGDND